MRVSTSSTYLQTAQALGGTLSRVQDLAQQLSTQRRVNRFSDDAPAAAAAGRYRAEEADWESLRRVGTDAKGWLSSADGALQSMSSVHARLRELAVSASNGGLSATGREAIAAEVDQLRDELRDLGNSRHQGRPLFGGFGQTALAPDGSWAGAAGSVLRQVSPTVTVQVNVDGQALFGDVFSTLTALSQAVRSSDDAGVRALQPALVSGHDRVLAALAQVGTTAQRVEAAYDAGGVAMGDLAARRSELEDVDLASAVLQLTSAQAGYEAALGAAARANLPSLASFLR